MQAISDARLSSAPRLPIPEIFVDEEEEEDRRSQSQATEESNLDGPIASPKGSHSSNMSSRPAETTSSSSSHRESFKASGSDETYELEGQPVEGHRYGDGREEMVI